MDKDTLIKLAKEVYRLTLLFPKYESLRYRIRGVADDIICDYIMQSPDYLNSLRARLQVIDGFFDVASSQNWVSSTQINQVRQGYSQILESLPFQQKWPLMARDAVCSPNDPALALDQETVVTKDSKEEKIKQIEVEYMPQFAPILPAGKPQDSPLIISLSNGGRENKRVTVTQTKQTVSSKVIEVGPAQIMPKTAGQPESETGADNEDEEESGSSLSAGQMLRQNRILEFLKEKGSAQVWEIQQVFPKTSKRTIRRDFASLLKQGIIERIGDRNTTAYKLKISLS